jgi:hypothetical protein
LCEILAEKFQVDVDKYKASIREFSICVGRELMVPPFSSAPSTLKAAEGGEEGPPPCLPAAGRGAERERRDDGKAGTRRGSKAKKKSQEPWVGELLCLRDGRLQVKWLTGSVSWVWPSEVLIINSDVDMWNDEEMEEEEEASDWETVGSRGSQEDPEGQLPGGDGFESSDVITQLNRLSRLAGGRPALEEGSDGEEEEEDYEDESHGDGDEEDEGAEDPAAVNGSGLSLPQSLVSIRVYCIRVNEIRISMDPDAEYMYTCE